MTSFFRFDGPLINILNKVGHIILASILWLAGCIPVITIGTSSSALYYAVVKSIRADRGYVAQEFFAAYKKCFKKGILFTIGFLAFGCILLLDYWYAGSKEGIQALVMREFYIIAGIFLGEIALYLFPLLSRFELPAKKLIKMAVFSIFKFLPYTIGCNLVLFVLFMGFRYLPLLGIFLFAGLGCLLNSYLLEHVLRAFMPEPETEEEKDMWYYSFVKSQK